MKSTNHYYDDKYRNSRHENHHHRSSRNNRFTEYDRHYNQNVKKHSEKRSVSHNRSRSPHNYSYNRTKSRSSINSESPVSHSSSLTSQNEIITQQTSNLAKINQNKRAKDEYEPISSPDTDDESNLAFENSANKSKKQRNDSQEPKSINIINNEPISLSEFDDELFLKGHALNKNVSEEKNLISKSKLLENDCYSMFGMTLKQQINHEKSFINESPISPTEKEKNKFSLENCNETTEASENENELRRSARLNTRKQQKLNDRMHAPTVSTNQQSPQPFKKLLLNKINHEYESEAFSMFTSINENEYHCKKHKNKDTKRMQCDCALNDNNSIGCGDDCLNRLLMIECSARCTLGENCSNKRFQRKEYAQIVPFKTGQKGWGLKALEEIRPNSFIIEYIGEVINLKEFKRRCEKYSKNKNEHFYLMALRNDQIIDATKKGNMARFFNHSCNPNCETQKWTVNGELRIGFFSRRSIAKDEELTFDYQFQTFGEEQQKCYCGSENCRGVLGQVNNNNNNTNQTYDHIWDTSDSESDEDSLKKRKKNRDDLDFKKQINDIKILNSRDNVLKICRLMFRAENLENRLSILRILLKTKQEILLKLFIDYHGLKLLWSWMIDIDRLNDLQNINLKQNILQVLEIMPIKNRTIVEESKLYATVKRWSEQNELKYTPSKESPNDSQNVEDVVKAQLDCIITWIENNLEIEEEIKKVSVKSKELYEKWSNLAQAFKIPKKQRIEERLEHERQITEAKSVEKQPDIDFGDYNRRHNLAKTNFTNKTSFYNKTRAKYFENRYNTMPKMSKEERRKLFEQRIRENEEKQARLEEEETRKLREEEELKRQEQIATHLQKQEQNMEELSKRISTLFPDPLLITQQNIQVAPQTRILQPMDISSPSPPPQAPPNKKKKRHKLPPNWKMAKNSKGKVYYYHVITKKSQWHFPRESKRTKKESIKKKQEIDFKSLTDDMKKKKDLFREELSKIVCKQLTTYLKSDCHAGHITNTDDFKHLARKFTHAILERELERALSNSEELTVNKRVKVKTHEYITKYMLKFNGDYSRKKDS